MQDKEIFERQAHDERLYEFEHNRHVSQICGILAQHLGFSSINASLFAQAAMHHDDGKLAIPAEIFNKPGKLTPEEFQLVKTHTALGSEMLEASVRFYEIAKTMARYHHEKWDGCGYEGLRGETIPKVARIVGIADVFDALMSARPYKKAWPLSETIAYIKEERGHHFDPAVVDALIKCIGEIAVIYEK